MHIFYNVLCTHSVSILNLNTMYFVKSTITLRNVNISESNKNPRFECIDGNFKCYSALFSFNELMK